MTREEAAIKVAEARQKAMDAAWELSFARVEEAEIWREEAIAKKENVQTAA